MTTLKAERRDMRTKAKKLRREGFVTGNVFGKNIDGSIPLQFPASEIEKILKDKNKGSEIILELDGKPMDALIKEISFNSMKHEVEEIDLQALVSGEKVHSVAEVIFQNHDKIFGGVLQENIREIPFKALPSALVDKVIIDVSRLHIGDSVKVKDLEIAADKDIELMIDPEETVVMLTAIHNAPIPEPEAEKSEE